jgi:transcription elongation factor GreA
VKQEIKAIYLKTQVCRKEAQGMLEMRIAKLEEVHSNARLIDETHLDVSKVLVLSNVKIKNQANGMEMKYRLVAESEADLKTGRISVTSPIGKDYLEIGWGMLQKSQFKQSVEIQILEITRDQTFNSVLRILLRKTVYKYNLILPI